MCLVVEPLNLNNQIMLDKSWKERYFKQGEDPYYDPDLLVGAELFQQRAIEELKKELIPNCTYESGLIFNAATKDAIEIIKNLKP